MRARGGQCRSTCGRFVEELDWDADCGSHGCGRSRELEGEGLLNVCDRVAIERKYKRSVIGVVS